MVPLLRRTLFYFGGAEVDEFFLFYFSPLAYLGPPAYLGPLVYFGPLIYFGPFISCKPYNPLLHKISGLKIYSYFKKIVNFQIF